MWTVVKLSDVATLSSGGTPSKANAAFWDGDIPWVSPKDMKVNHVRDAEDKITRAAISESAARIVGSNSVLAVVRSGILAHTFPVATLAREVSFNQDIKAITPKNGSLLPAFLFWMLKGQEAQILRIGVKKGATVHSLSNGFLESLRFPLPPLDDQRRIVGLLDRAAEIRRRADAARAKACAIIPALFLDTFGDPATNPKGWPVVTLGNTIISGPQNGLYKPATDYGSGVRILRIDSFDDGTIANQGALKRLRLDQETTDKFKLSEGDIVVNRVNSPPQLGKSVLIPRLEEPVVFESNMMRMRVNSDLLLPRVLGVMLQLNSVRQALIKNAKHAINQSSINQGDVTGITVFAPPIPLQSVFAEHIQRIDAVARHLDAAAAKAEAMAAGLSAEVFGQSPSKGNEHG
jgi:type I restriction enzyme, S subunit